MLLLNVICFLYTWKIIFSSLQSLSCVWLSATPWIAAHQASLSITNSRSSLRLTSSESVMPSSHLILCHPLLLLPQIPPNIRLFSNESTLCMRQPKYWSFSFSIIPSKEIPGLISFRMDGWISLQSKGLSRVFSNTTVQKHQFFGAQPSSQSVWDWNENWPFSVLWPLPSFANLLAYWLQHFHSIIFQDLKKLNWNSITSTSFVRSDALLSKAHLTSHSRMSGSTRF